MTESSFVERLIQALSQPTTPSGAPAMVASYTPRPATAKPAPRLPLPTSTR
jgi:hypothetical protein